MNKHKRHILRQRQQKRSHRRQQPLTSVDVAPAPSAVPPSCLVIEEANCSIVPYDENLLERSRTQWQFGDWDSLAQLSRDTLQHHPDRAKLALLAAAGLLQTGDTGNARQYVRLAQDWGCSKKLISQILIAGVHNSLGRAAAIGGQEQQALSHFGNAIATGMPGSDLSLISRARVNQQYSQIYLKNSPANDFEPIKNSFSVASNTITTIPHLFAIKTEIDNKESEIFFNTLNSGYFSLSINVLKFKIPDNKPAYLVSTETGGFKKNNINQLNLQPGFEYKVDGYINYAAETPPDFWIFQYSNGEKCSSQNITVGNGSFTLRFKMLDTAESVAFGIRVIANGEINIDKSWLIISSSQISLEDAGKKWIHELCEQEYKSQKFIRFNERPAEFAFLFNAITKHYPKKILDVGTGLTALPHLLKNCGTLVTAIDNIRDYWNESIINRHYFVIDDDITNSKLQQSFDFISCISVLEHIEKFNAAIKSMVSLLEPHGLLLLTFPYSENEYVNNVYNLPDSSYGHNSPYITQSFSRKNIDEWITDNPIKLIEQEYWQYWTGNYWTVGAQIIPPIKTKNNQTHQLTCILFEKHI